MSEFSQPRLESRIIEGVSSLIVSGAIKNHNLSTLVSVTGVDLSPDNSQAKVYISYIKDDQTLEKSVLAQRPGMADLLAFIFPFVLPER